MNKNILKLSTAVAFIFLLISFFSAKAFCLSLSDQAIITAGVSLEQINITYNQDAYILQGSSVGVTGQVNAPSSVTITSVTVNYYQGDPGSSLPLSSATATFTPNVSGGGTFDALMQNLDNTNSLPCYYQIVVNYVGGTYQSQWYVIYNPSIIHTNVQRVSPYQLDVVLIGISSGVTVSSISVEYAYNGDTTTVYNVGTNNRLNFQSVPFHVDASKASVSYRIKAAVATKIVGIAPEKLVKYYPYDMSWVTAPITDNVNVLVDKTLGGTVILDNEDQRYGKTKITFNPNALSASKNITITECKLNDTYPWPADSKMVKLYNITPAAEVLSSTSDVALYYGDAENNPLAKAVTADKYVAQWWDSGNSKWIELNSSKQNTPERTVSGKTDKLGYFAIIMNPLSVDTGYRPTQRAFRPGETIEFRNLQVGDTVTIYNLRGQEVTKLVSAPFVWDGKKNGSYIESGSYIYQIKTNGKVISGSLAFFR